MRVFSSSRSVIIRFQTLVLGKYWFATSLITAWMYLPLFPSSLCRNLYFFILVFDSRNKDVYWETITTLQWKIFGIVLLVQSIERQTDRPEQAYSKVPCLDHQPRNLSFRILILQNSILENRYHTLNPPLNEPPNWSNCQKANRYASKSSTLIGFCDKIGRATLISNPKSTQTLGQHWFAWQTEILHHP